MSANYIFWGALMATFVFGAYFLGLVPKARSATGTPNVPLDIRDSLSWIGFGWAVALPTMWLLLYYGFIADLRFTLGRWPNFGEALPNWSLAFQNEAVGHFLGALVGSLYLTPLVLICCLIFPRWKHVSVYVLCYAAGVGIASGSLFLAPKPFLNWLFD